MTKIYLTIIFLLLPLAIRSQEDIYIGNKYKIYSDSLQENREYWVYLPEDYSQNKHQSYSVIYLLDGDLFFHSLVGISKTLSSGRGNFRDSHIIVGVLNTDRTRDMTPTATTLGRDGKSLFFDSPQGGGSEKLHHFLVKELRTVIDNTFRTSGTNILIGHSYGGLFTINTFLHHPEEFDSYIAIDPSLWWDNGRLVNEASSLIEGKDFSGKSLYIGIASKKRTDRIDIHLQKVHHLIFEILPKAKNLNFSSKSFPEENHGTVAIPGIYDGFKHIFKQ